MRTYGASRRCSTSSSPRATASPSPCSRPIRRCWPRPGSCSSRKSPASSMTWPWPCDLSLFLWNSTPDPTLRDLAARGELHNPEVLRAQTRRLLDDPQVAAVRRRVHRLLARPPQDRRDLAVLHDLQRLRARRPAQATPPSRRRASSSASWSAPTCPPETWSIPTSRSSTSGWPVTTASPAWRAPRCGRSPCPPDSLARRRHDAGGGAQGHRQRHDHVPGHPRPLDHRTHPRHRNPARRRRPSRRSSPTSAAPSRSASSSRSTVPIRAVRPATR